MLVRLSTCSIPVAALLKERPSGSKKEVSSRRHAHDRGGRIIVTIFTAVSAAAAPSSSSSLRKVVSSASRIGSSSLPTERVSDGECLVDHILQISSRSAADWREADRVIDDNQIGSLTSVGTSQGKRISGVVAANFITGLFVLRLIGRCVVKLKGKSITRRLGWKDGWDDAVESVLNTGRARKLLSLATTFIVVRDSILEASGDECKEENEVELHLAGISVRCAIVVSWIRFEIVRPLQKEES